MLATVEAMAIKLVEFNARLHRIEEVQKQFF